jgi:malate dehydrogenase (oxaloacetate-decarboxylating)(NADP+)
LVLVGSIPATAQQITGTPGAPGATTTIDGGYMPPQTPPFPGHIEPNAAQSTPAWPMLVVPDEMFIEAAYGVADQVKPELLKQGLLYPLQADILETEIQTAARVAKLVFDSGLARVERPADMLSFIRRRVYKPEYPSETVAATKAA